MQSQNADTMRDQNVCGRKDEQERKKGREGTKENGEQVLETVCVFCPIMRNCNVMSSSSESSCIYREPVCVHGPTAPTVSLYKVLVEVFFASLELPD